MPTTKAEKWNSLFEGGAKYRNLNEVFVKDLLDDVTDKGKEVLKNVVDLGCGNGETLSLFSKIGLFVTGIDVSSKALELAKEKLVGSNYRLVELDLDEISSLEITSSGKTLWLCKLVLAFIKDKAEFLKTIRDKMNSGDVLMVMTPILRSDVTYAKEDKPGIAIKIDEIEKILKDVFGQYDVFSNEYPGERGRVVTYLMRK